MQALGLGNLTFTTIHNSGFRYTDHVLEAFAFWGDVGCGSKGFGGPWAVGFRPPSGPRRPGLLSKGAGAFIVSVRAYERFAV